MSATTGRRLTGIDHLRQSVRDIIMTPIGSRVMNREYGSYVFLLIDHPGNPSNLMQIYSAVVVALLRWEPRIAVRRVQLVGGEMEKGAFNLEIDADAVEPIDDIRPGTALRVAIPLGTTA